MKKKITIAIVLVLALAATSFLWACSRFPAPRDLEWDSNKANYVVTGNGTAVVQQGRYVYFVNGYRPADYDADRTSSTNRWGDVVRGGIYRATLHGDSVETGTSRDWNITDVPVYLDPYREQPSDRVNMSFASTTKSIPVLQTDGEFEYEYRTVFDVVPVVPMIGAVSGMDVGLFIFGEFIYYTSPATNVNRDREVEFERTAFWRTRLDGTGTERIFTTAGDSIPRHSFFFVHGDTPRQDRVYLALLEDNDIISFGMNADGRGSIRRQTLVQNVNDDAIFPRMPTFDINNRPVMCDYLNQPSVRAEDYIYFTRDARIYEDVTPGNITERVRPNGTVWKYAYRRGNREYDWRYGSQELFARNRTITLHSVRNNVLFYTVQAIGSSAIEMHFDNFLPGRLSIASSRNPVVANIAGYDEIFPFRGSDDNSSNEAFAITFTGDTIGLRQNHQLRTLLRNVSGLRFEFFDGEFVYFIRDSFLYRVRFTADYDSQGDTSERMTEYPILTTYLRTAKTANHIMFFREIDNHARDDHYSWNYAFFMRATVNPNEREFWMGIRCANDFPDEEEDEEYDDLD
ncbi:MAG: hypothetical protein FWC80_03695 [Firmicutes bacterium]|nr:hypothetical protein [Bacillota bacterium]